MRYTNQHLPLPSKAVSLLGTSGHHSCTNHHVNQAQRDCYWSMTLTAEACGRHGPTLLVWRSMHFVWLDRWTLNSVTSQWNVGLLWNLRDWRIVCKMHNTSLSRWGKTTLNTRLCKHLRCTHGDVWRELLEKERRNASEKSVPSLLCQAMYIVHWSVVFICICSVYSVSTLFPKKSTSFPWLPHDLQGSFFITVRCRTVMENDPWRSCGIHGKDMDSHQRSQHQHHTKV